MGAIIAVNGSDIAAYVVDLGTGYRIRFGIDDWEGLRLYRGQRINVRLPGDKEMWLYLSEVVEIPPVAWVVMTPRLLSQAG